MFQTENVLSAISVEADADLLSNRRFVKAKSTNGKLAYCGAGEKAIGVLALPQVAGDMATANIKGKLLVESGGAISPGDSVTSDSLGRAVRNPKLTFTNPGSSETTFTLLQTPDTLTIAVPPGAISIDGKGHSGIALTGASGAGELIAILM